MSATAITMLGFSVATRFYGGQARGKVVQLHMEPTDLTELLAAELVEDSDTGRIEPFSEWLARETSNAGMVLFTGSAEPKVQTIEMTAEKVR